MLEGLAVLQLEIVPVLRAIRNPEVQQVPGLVAELAHVLIDIAVNPVRDFLADAVVTFTEG
jgi:hypothetical protein